MSRKSKTRPSLNRTSSVALMLALLLASPLSLGFDLESDQPIRVNADKARLDDASGQATYEGDVQVRQGATQLTAEKVVLYRSETGLDRIEAYGEPARYTQGETEKTPATEARAHQIIYSASEGRITFLEQAVISQNGNEFRGDRILYDTRKRVVTADGGDTEDDGRVEMIIQPRAVEGGGQ